VDLTRQVLANYAYPLQKKWVKAFEEKDAAAFEKYSQQFISLISDMDALLATRKDFLLGPWIADARRCGITLDEKNLYEKNARNLITLWGDVNSPLHEYSCRQWSGLLSSFYKPRWEQFFEKLHASMQSGILMDIPAFDKQVREWEWRWVNEQKAFSEEVNGSSIAVAKRLYDKYRKAISE
jgi:alpha-N-acetylglucosaminidase